MQLSGMAVRQEPVDETKVIVGCTVKQANLDLGLMSPPSRSRKLPDDMETDENPAKKC